MVRALIGDILSGKAGAEKKREWVGGKTLIKHVINKSYSCKSRESSTLIRPSQLSENVYTAEVK